MIVAEWQFFTVVIISSTVFMWKLLFCWRIETLIWKAFLYNQFSKINLVRCFLSSKLLLLSSNIYQTKTSTCAIFVDTMFDFIRPPQVVEEQMATLLVVLSIELLVTPLIQNCKTTLQKSVTVLSFLLFLLLYLSSIISLY
jgi:hypothetical protein